ncbi:MAG: hypothetical protein COA70_09660 [Planctomycetota bacterium]|nr:MAG: hypothetical protein COA70_09660 [Planctomycetota bacterium]
MGDNFVIFNQWQIKELGFPGWHESQRFWSPSADDVALFDAGLQAALEDAVEHPELYDEWSGKSESRAQFVSSETEKILGRLSGYRRQVFGIVVDGERKLYVSFLPGADWNEYGDIFSDWKTRTMMTSDGGFWFWNIEFSPESKKYSKLDSHGYA